MFTKDKSVLLFRNITSLQFQQWCMFSVGDQTMAKYCTWLSKLLQKFHTWNVPKQQAHPGTDKNVKCQLRNTFCSPARNCSIFISPLEMSVFSNINFLISYIYSKNKICNTVKPYFSCALYLVNFMISATLQK